MQPKQHRYCINGAAYLDTKLASWIAWDVLREWVD